MKDIIIKPSNHAYKEFFKDDGSLSFRNTVYSAGTLLYSSYGDFKGTGGDLLYFKINHKDFIHAALYEASLKGKNIILKFVRITGEENERS